jgi:heme-degrading monooxygenase HmoA
MMVVEITTFRLVDGADEAAFLEADHRVQTEFFPNFPGFTRRTTARGHDGEWLVVVLWGSEQNAKAAEQLGSEHAAMQAFSAFVDASTVRVRRYTSLD